MVLGSTTEYVLRNAPCPVFPIDSLKVQAFNGSRFGSDQVLAAAVQMVADDKAANLNEAEHWIREPRPRRALVVAAGSLHLARQKNGNASLPNRFPVRLRRAWPSWRANCAFICSAARSSRRFPAAPKPTTPVCSSILPANSLQAIARFISSMSTCQRCFAARSETRECGDGVVVAELSFAQWGYRFATICVFPSSIVDCRSGRAVIFVPSAFTAFTGAAHWETLAARPRHREPSLRNCRRSIRQSAKSFESHGHSMIVDPWGTILAELPMVQGNHSRNRFRLSCQSARRAACARTPRVI